MMGFGWGAGVGGWLWMVGGLIVMIGIVVLVVWAIGGYNRSADWPAGHSARPEPLDLLRERFARGEISEAEFEQAKRILGYDK
jgi:putative membrane protein